MQEISDPSDNCFTDVECAQFLQQNIVIYKIEYLPKVKQDYPDDSPVAVRRTVPSVNHTHWRLGSADTRDGADLPRTDFGENGWFNVILHNKVFSHLGYDRCQRNRAQVLVDVLHWILLKKRDEVSLLPCLRESALGEGTIDIASDDRRQEVGVFFQQPPGNAIRTRSFGWI